MKGEVWTNRDSCCLKCSGASSFREEFPCRVPSYCHQGTGQNLRVTEFPFAPVRLPFLTSWFPYPHTPSTGPRNVPNSPSETESRLPPTPRVPTSPQTTMKLSEILGHRFKWLDKCNSLHSLAWTDGLSARGGWPIRIFSDEAHEPRETAGLRSHLPPNPRIILEHGWLFRKGLIPAMS